MRRLSFISAAMLFSVMCCFYGQSVSYRAQGKYYSAKEAFSKTNYTAAILFLDECNVLMQEKSNSLIEYIRILSYYNLGNFIGSEKSMNRFFDLIEGREKPLEFATSVERLTDTEVKDITKLIDRITAKAEEQKQFLEREKTEKPLREKKAAFLSLVKDIESSMDKTTYTYEEGLESSWERIAYSISCDETGFVLSKKGKRHSTGTDFGRNVIIDYWKYETFTAFEKVLWKSMKTVERKSNFVYLSLDKMPRVRIEEQVWSTRYGRNDKPEAYIKDESVSTNSENPMIWKFNSADEAQNMQKKLQGVLEGSR